MPILENDKYKGYKLRTKQCLSMTRLINRVCAPIWNGSHIVSTLLHCGLQRNDQYRTHSPRLFPLLPSNHQRKEQLCQCQNLIEWQTELDPGKPFYSLFFKDQEEHSTQVDWFWIYWPVWFSLSELPQQIFCKVNSLFSLLFHHEYMAVGSGLAQGWYLILGESQQKRTVKTNRSKWWQIAGLHQSRTVHRSNICVL